MMRGVLSGIFFEYDKPPGCMDEFVEHIWPATKFVFGRAKGHPPTVIVFTDSGMRLLNVSSLSDQRDLLSGLMQAMAKQDDTIAMAFVSEVWMVRIEGEKAKEGIDMDAKVDLSEHPDRVERLFVSVETRSGENVDIYAEIIRTDDEVKLGEDHIERPIMSQGRFCGFFEANETVH